VVDAEDNAGEDVKKDPDSGPDASEAIWDSQGCEEQGHGGEEEAGFLVLESGEAGGAGDAGPEEGVEGACEGEEKDGGAEELREVGEEVLVVGMETVRGEIGGV